MLSMTSGIHHCISSRKGPAHIKESYCNPTGVFQEHSEKHQRKWEGNDMFLVWV